MKGLIIGVISLFAIAMSGCGGDDDDHCTQNVSGCNADDWSCPESNYCYATDYGCSVSGDCG